ncbi:MAG: LptF/LptG family permease, partial [Elusimicrobia bacterium]|nr:LptF/LptG family permease [Elusimicrobiota bacterium]MBD3412073.1 LptF/LptG family permease [Elusimicrobiota bacterium]
VAWAPLAFCLIGMTLGIKVERGGKSIGFGVSLLIIFVYYLLLVGGITLSEKGILAPWFNLWLCNIITMLVGLFLLVQLFRK